MIFGTYRLHLKFGFGCARTTTSMSMFGPVSEASKGYIQYVSSPIHIMPSSDLLTSAGPWAIDDQWRACRMVSGGSTSGNNPFRPDVTRYD
jgi:hypothetical protein